MMIGGITTIGGFGHDGTMPPDGGVVPPVEGGDTGDLGGVQIGALPPDGKCGRLEIGKETGGMTTGGIHAIGGTLVDGGVLPPGDDVPVWQVGPTTETLKGKLMAGGPLTPTGPWVNDVLPHDEPVVNVEAGPPKKPPKKNVAEAVLPVSGMTPAIANDARPVDASALARI